MSDNNKGKNSLDQEDVEKLYEHFEEGSTYDEILDDDDLDVGSRSTISRYKKAWEEEKELEEEIHEKELTPDTFLNKLKNVPRMGDKKRNFAYKLAKLNPKALQDPNKVFRILKKAKLDDDIAETVVEGILSEYFTDDQGNDPRWANQQRGRGSRNHPTFREPGASTGGGDLDLGGGQQQQRPQGQPVQRQQQPRQPRSQPKRGASSNPPEGYVIRKYPQRDENGNIVRDENGEKVMEEVQIPIDKAQEFNAGTGDQKADESSKLEEIALEMVKEKVKSDDDEGQKADPAMMKMVKEMQKSNQQTQQMIAQMMRDEQEGAKQEEEDEGESIEEVKEYFDEKMREMKRQQEMEQKEERIDDLQGKLNTLAEKHEEALEEMKNKEYSEMPPEQQEKKWEKEMTELTADKTKDMVESFTEQGGKVNENIIDNLTTLFNEMKSQGELTRQEDAYKDLVMNLQEQEGWPLEKAKRKAEELLYGKRVDFSNQPQQQSRDRKESGGSSSSNKSELEQVVEESKRRAKSEG